MVEEGMGDCLNLLISFDSGVLLNFGDFDIFGDSFVDCGL